MARYEYYDDGSGICCVAGTTYSFQDATDLIDWAEKNGHELTEVDLPETINYDGPTW